MNTSMQKRLAPLLVGLAVTLAPLAAQAQRKSPLADAPAIRKRVELRSTRLEFGGGFGSTLNQDFFHTMMVNVKLGFHFTDWLSLAGFAGFGVANIATGFQDRVVETLDPNMGSVPREPTQSEAQASMSKITSVLGAQLEFTPFTGKYSMFGKLFAHYDFYAFVGPGFLNVQPASTLNSQAPCVDNSAAGVRACTVSGIKPGGNIGLGLHTYFNDWIALNVELRDIIAQINPAGRDVNGDGHADNNDLTWSHTWMVGANVVLYLPATADISP